MAPSIFITDTCCSTIPAHSGKQFVDHVGSNGTGGISQQFCITPNQQYVLQFAYSHNTGVSSASASVILSDDAMVPLLSTAVVHSGAARASFLITFIATSSQTTLAFNNLTGGMNQVCSWTASRWRTPRSRLACPCSRRLSPLWPSFGGATRPGLGLAMRRR